MCFKQDLDGVQVVEVLQSKFVSDPILTYSSFDFTRRVKSCNLREDLIHTNSVGFP